ncbi:hypothetical protein TPENAI_50275 [Tenacibaculum litopenaei]|jgi:hypothetical protein|uniref:hypothetical protein n=1 Tax=Tenacibaculum litopenaei TaxID=396016 RepID=UPI00389353D9
MLKNISNIGTPLNKSEQQEIKGGFRLIVCHSCEPLPPGYACMNDVICGDI